METKPETDEKNPPFLPAFEPRSRAVSERVVSRSDKHFPQFRVLMYYRTIFPLQENVMIRRESRHRSTQRLSVLLTFFFLSVPSPGSAQGIYPAYTGAPPPESPSSAPGRIVAPQTTVENGLLCTSIDFEGAGDLNPVPVFDGIRSPDWLSIIDLDAGGSGNFAFEPSPQTIAFWLGGPNGTGSSRDIVLDEPASVVEFEYVSAVTTRLQAFDTANRLLATATGGANFNRGPGGDPTGQYNRWDPLRLEIAGNRIARIRVSGAINQTGIDDLKVCRRTGIDTVEITQAIQEIQDLDDLKADLARDGQPPVPLVRGKPGALRAYFEEVQAVTQLTVEVTEGTRRQTKRVTLLPGCTRGRARRGECPSADFSLRLRGAEVPVEVTVKDQSGLQIESHSFRLRPRDAEPLVLAAVKVCDEQNAQGGWTCFETPFRRLAQIVTLLRQIAPTHEVRVVDSGESVRRAIDENGDGTVDPTRGGEASRWWYRVSRDVAALAGISEALSDLFGREDRRYYGITRANLAGGTLGRAGGFGSRGALSRTIARDRNTDVTQDTVAHETFHMLGRHHTNRGTPTSNCALAPDDGTDWVFPNNRLFSGDRRDHRVEHGYDVARRMAIPGDRYFDIMSYCVPVWISPFTYTRLFEDELRKAAERRAETKRIETGRFWLVAGGVEGDDLALDPIFELTTAGEMGPGTGAYRIEVRGGNEVLFTRRFDPEISAARVRGGGSDLPPQPFFSELVPAQAGATRIVVRAPDGTTLLSAGLAGTAPSVTLLSPTGGGTLRGSQTVRWRVDDPDDDAHRFWVRYSPVNGTPDSWRTLGFTDRTQLTVDFDQVPGSAGAGVIQVLASDGTLTGSVRSAPFTVPAGAPDAVITLPEDGAIFAPGGDIWLQATAFDREDGELTGSSLTWRSNRDGALGEGPSPQVSDLSTGPHTLTLTARDSDGNVARREVRVTIAGAGPILDLEVEALDSLPTTCVETTIQARPGSVGLRRVDYSLDGGDTWTTVSLGSLPHRFIVPGSGFFHLVARAVDRAGQTAAEDTRFFTDSPCAETGPPAPSPPPGAWLTAPGLSGYRFKTRLTSGGGTPIQGRREADCIDETLCVSGALRGRSELFARVIGPRPNGFVWVNLVRFTTSEVEVWVEQRAGGAINYYRLPEIARASDDLSGLVDKEAFSDRGGSRRSGLRRERRLEDAGVEAIREGTLFAAAIPTGETIHHRADVETPTDATGHSKVIFRTPEIPGFRFTVRIFSGGSEVQARREADCLSETACVSGALAGRSELFVRIIGPRPNGFLWVNLVRFTTSRVEVDVEKIGAGVTQRYVLPAIPRESDLLTGLVDKEAFSP